MSKTTIKELASSLSDKHDLSKADAERFVAAIFEVINEGLEDDKLVKVKGLGAFKIIGIAARKSVDVNTGEPIVIEGRNKISFTPDASMRDDVNKPFSQFETVVINDGVDFSSIDEEYENGKMTDSEPDSEAAPQTTTENIVDEVKNTESEKVNEVAPISTSSVESLSVKESHDPQREHPTRQDNLDNVHSEKSSSLKEYAPIEESNPVEENIPIEENTTIHKTIQAEEDVSAKEDNSTAKEDSFAKEDTSTEKDDTHEKADASEEADSSEKEIERELLVNEEIHQSHTLKALIVTAVVIVIGCVCGGYYLFSQIQKRDSHIEMLEKQMRLVAQHHDENGSKNEPSKAFKEERQEPVKGQDQDSVTHKVDVKKEATKQVSKEDNKQVSQDIDKDKALQDKYNQDVRIRTGAYVIIGIKNTVTVRSGQTMEGISRSTLGPGMQCYLEAVNGGKRELKAGESINIPQLKLKKRLR